MAESAYRAESATPAFLAHWAIRQFDIGTRPDTVTGVTVVSTVNRGPADLAWPAAVSGSRPAFPPCRRVRGLTHGVHGIGSAVAISVTTSPEIVDVDAYVEMLRRALDRWSPQDRPDPDRAAVKHQIRNRPFGQFRVIV